MSVFFSSKYVKLRSVNSIWWAHNRGLFSGLKFSMRVKLMSIYFNEHPHHGMEIIRHIHFMMQGDVYLTYWKQCIYICVKALD